MDRHTLAHYASLLAPVYGWMHGAPSAALFRSHGELTALGIGEAHPGARALDLGAGNGLQTIPLRALGYEVTAVDTSNALLAELAAACPDAHLVSADLAALDTIACGAFDVVVCMGDTLPHLGSEDEVRAALTAAAARLEPGGRIALTFRDYVTRDRRGTDRFLFVRGDDTRLLSCCLDYEERHVVVTDLLHERAAPSAPWTMRASSYRKLRLAPAVVTRALEDAGLHVSRCDTALGRVAIVAER